MTDTPLRIIARKLDDLVPYERNPRVHSAAQIQKIVASILEFGWTNPALTDGALGLVAGHGRYAAALIIRDDPAAVIPNWPDKTTMPTINLEHLSDVQKRAYIISDNAIALDAEWNNELLGIELQSLHDEGFALDLTGLDADKLSTAMYPETTEPPTAVAEDDTPRCPECGQKLKR